MQNDERLTRNYTRGDDDVKESVRETHPNRKVDKGEQPGSGGS